MLSEDFTVIADSAKKKWGFLEKNPFGYFISAMLAGAFVGFGILLAFTIGGLAAGSSFTRALTGMTFGIALSLVVFAGSELFTGNNLVMTAGVLRKKVKFSQAIKLLLICYIGNWIGSIAVAAMYLGTGHTYGAAGEYMAQLSLYKMNAGVMQLFWRGVLCNILVCLASWCCYRMKSETGKLIMIFWCVFAFVTAGFEHSIANMTLFSVSMLSPLGYEITLGGYLYNLSIVTFGNMVGGILFVALPYWIISGRNSDS